MCRRTGWTWDHVWETLTVPRLEALEREWAEEPVTHLLVSLLAQFIGWKAPTPAAPMVLQPDGVKPAEKPFDPTWIMEMFPSGSG